jgi:outer membrane biosynthesis protein TonB
MDVRRKINELRIDLQGLTDQRFADESDERVIAGLVDKTLNSLDELASESDMLAQRLNIMERMLSGLDLAAVEKKAALAKPAPKPVKVVKAKKPVKKKAKAKPKPKKKAKKPKKAIKKKAKKAKKKPAKKKAKKTVKKKAKKPVKKKVKKKAKPKKKKKR